MTGEVEGRRVASSLAEYLADSSSILPEPIDIASAVEQMQALHEANGGVTFNLYFGDMSGQSLYAVSLYPERGRRAAGETVSVRILRQFVLENLDLLRNPRDPRNNIGLWYNRVDNVTYRDVSATLPDRGQAITLAGQYKQIAIFDLARFEEIDTGGNGEIPPGMPSEAERLPKIQRQESKVV